MDESEAQREKQVIDLCMTGKQSRGWMAAFALVGGAVKPRRSIPYVCEMFHQSGSVSNLISFEAYTLSKLCTEKGLFNRM